MKRICASLIGAALTLCTATSAWSQEAFPSKLVKIVVPFAAGGSTDLLARALAERLAVMWKQPVIVENRGGASGMIGSDAVAKSTPDGHTILMAAAPTYAVTQAIQPKVSYDIQRDFVPISELVTIPQLLSVHPSLPVNSVQELVAYAKARPGELTHGNSTGSSAQMAMELLAWRAGIKTLHVPYRGSGPTMVDLQGGTLNAGFDVIMTSLPLTKSGRLRTLAVTSSQRSPLLPNIPTISETGFPGFEASVSFGLFAPAKTAPAIVKKIGEDTKRVLMEPKMKATLEEQGFQIVASDSRAFEKRVGSELEKWRKLTTDANIKIE